MAAILVDYENVNGSNGLKGADALCADDTLIIFYSNCCGKIRCDYLQDIKDSGCEFRVVKLKGSGKNALDFYIAAECGIISERGEKKIGIISNDKGFQAVIDFFCVNRDAAKPQVVKAGNIENAFTLFNSSRDIWRRKMLQNRMSTLDLAAAFLRMALGDEDKSVEVDDFGDTGAEDGMVRLFINIGKNQKARPGDILGAIAGETGIAGSLIGTIDMYDKYTFVEVPKEYARDVLNAMSHARIKGRNINIEPANRK